MHKKKNIFNISARYFPSLINANIAYRIPFLYPLLKEAHSYAAVNVTDRCNFQCVTCGAWHSDGAGELTTDGWKNVLKQLKDNRISNVVFAGGEPLLRKDLPELVETAKNFGMSVGLITNGYLLDKPLLDTLIESGTKFIAVSVDGIGEEFESVRGIKGSYEKVEKACELIAGRINEGKLKGIISFTLTKKTIAYLPSVLAFRKKLNIPIGLNLLDSTPYFFRAGRSSMERDDYWPDETTVAEAQRILVEQKNRDRDSVNLLYSEIAFMRNYFANPQQEKLPCVTSQKRLCIDSKGNVFGGCWSMGRRGNLTINPLTEILRSPEYKAAEKCMFFKKCPGCASGISVSLRHSPMILLKELFYVLFPILRKSIYQITNPDRRLMPPLQTVARNSAYNILTLLLPALLLIFATPFLVKELGLELYGIWAICSILLGLADLLDFGLKMTATAFIPKYIAKKDLDGLNRHINSILRFTAGLGAIFSILLFLAAPALASHFFNIPDRHYADSLKSFYMLSLGVLPTIIVNLMASIAIGFQRFDVSSALLAGRNAINTLGVVVIVSVTGVLAPAVEYSVILNWCFAFIGIFMLKRVFPGWNMRVAGTLRDLKEIASFGGISLLTNLTLTAMGIFDRLFIGFFLNAAAVTLYSVPMAILGKVEQIIVRIAQVFLPHLSGVVEKDLAREEKDWKKIFRIALDAELFLAFLAATWIFIMGGPVLRIWMGNAFAEKATWVLKGLTVGYLFRTCNIVPSFVLFTLKKPSVNLWANATAGLTYLALIAMFALKVPLGVLAFSSGAYVISLLVSFVYLSGDMKKSFMWHAAPYIITSVLITVFTRFLAPGIEEMGGILPVAGVSAGIFILYAVFAVGFLSLRHEPLRLNMVFRFLKKKKG